jgi:hypothetical protein
MNENYSNFIELVNCLTCFESENVRFKILELLIARPEFKQILAGEVDLTSNLNFLKQF